MKFINIGSGNMVAAQRVIALASPESAPIKRLVSEAKEEGRVIDVSCGRRTRTVIITDSDHIILSALRTETISNRLYDSDAADTDDDNCFIYHVFVCGAEKIGVCVRHSCRTGVWNNYFIIFT